MRSEPLAGRVETAGHPTPSPVAVAAPPPLGWWGSDAFCAQGTKEKKPSCCGCCQQTPAEQGS